MHFAVLCFTLTCCVDLETKLELCILYSFPPPKEHPPWAHGGRQLPHQQPTSEPATPCKDKKTAGPMPGVNAVRKAGRNNQGVSGEQAACERQEQRGLCLLGDLVFLLHGIFGSSFLLGHGLPGAETPTQQTRTLHLLPYRLEINCLDLGKLLCNPAN